MTPECHCEETHDADCPRLAADEIYWREYFAVGSEAFWNFAPKGGQKTDGNV